MTGFLSCECLLCLKASAGVLECLASVLAELLNSGSNQSACWCLAVFSDPNLTLASHQCCAGCGMRCSLCGVELMAQVHANC